MTSKHLLLRRMKENSHRRKWLFVFELILFFMVLVLFPLARINGSRASGMTSDAFIRSMGGNVFHYLGSNAILGFSVVACGVMSAINGYYYLYSRKKVDMYTSQPVHPLLRYFSIYLNSVLYFLIAYLANLVISLLVMSGYGGMNAKIVGKVCILTLYHITAYLAVFNTTILAVMLTGNFLNGFFMAGILHGFEAFVRYLIICGLEIEFFKTFSFNSTNSVFETVFSAVPLYFVGLNKFDQVKYMDVASAHCFFHVAVLMVVYFALALWAGMKRKAEASQTALAFTWMKPVISIVISVFSGLICGYLFYSISGNNSIFAYTGCIIAAIVTFCIIRLIYGESIGSCIRKPVQICCAMLFTILVFCTFQYDFIGYDSRMMPLNQVKSVTVMFNSQLNQSYEIDGQNNVKYMDKNMNITDMELIRQLICADYFHQTGNREFEKDEKQQYQTVDVYFHMKNGSTKYRMYYIMCDKQVDVMNAFLSSEEYKQGVFAPLLLNDEKRDNLNMSLTFGKNGLFDTAEISQEHQDEILKAIRKDIQNYSFDMAQNPYTVCLEIYSKEDSLSTYSTRLEQMLYINDNYNNTMDVLKKLNYFEAMKSDEIEKISVNYYPESEIDYFYGIYETEESTVSDGITVEITDPNQIESLKKNMVLSDYKYVSWSNDTSKYYKDVVCTVEYKNGGTGMWYICKQPQLSEDILSLLPFLK